jgi:hypothetical protein
MKGARRLENEAQAAISRGWKERGFRDLLLLSRAYTIAVRGDSVEICDENQRIVDAIQRRWNINSIKEHAAIDAERDEAGRRPEQAAIGRGWKERGFLDLLLLSRAYTIAVRGDSVEICDENQRIVDAIRRRWNINSIKEHAAIDAERAKPGGAS